MSDPLFRAAFTGKVGREKDCSVSGKGRNRETSPKGFAEENVCPCVTKLWQHSC